MTRRRLRNVVAVCLLVLAPCALAQGGLPAEIVEAPVVNDIQAEQIKQYVSGPLEALTDADATLINRARDTLLAPFKDRRATVAFRQKYNDLTFKRLKECADDARDVVATNALRILGEMATSDAVGVLTDKLKDKRDAIRLFTAAQAGRVFRLMDETQPAVGTDDLVRLIQRLADQVTLEEHGRVLEADVRALVAAAEMDRFDQIRHQAFSLLCTKVAERIGKFPKWPQAAALLPAILDAQTAVRKAQTENNPKMALSDAEQLAALALHGQVLFWVVTHTKDFPQGEPGLRDLAGKMVRVAETACVVGIQRQGGQYAGQNMAADFEKATPDGDREFISRKALELFKVLQGPPFNLAPFDHK